MREPSRTAQPRAGNAGRAAFALDSLSRSTAFIVAFVYTLLLWVNYAEYISPRFAYLGFIYFPHEFAWLAVDCLLAALPALFVPLAIRKPSDLGVSLLYVIVYIPSILITTLANREVGGEIFALKFVMLATMWLLHVVADWVPKRTFSAITISPGVFLLGSIALGIASIGVLGLTYGYSIVLHNFSDVYEQRDLFKEGLGVAGYSTYLVGLTSNVLGPALVGYGLVFRRPLFIAIGSAMALYVFSITGLKSAILAIAYCLMLYVGMSWLRRSFLVPVLLAAVALCIAGMLMAGLSSLDIINNLFVRRVFMLQGLMTNYYFEYFSSNDFLYLSHSILSPFFSGSALVSPADVIGDVYFNGGVHANGNIWADGYLNAGYLGMALSAAAVGVFLRALNYCMARTDLKFACCASAMVLMMLCQTGLVVVLGTHGGLFALLLYLVCEIRAHSDKPSPARARPVPARTATT